MHPLLLAAALSAAPAPAADTGYLAELQAAARARRLHEDRGWLRLGHWRPTLLGGLESEVVGGEFFLAPGGRADPDAELQATLAGLFAPEPADEKAMHPQCRFPARLAFLVRSLGLDPARLPPRECPRLAEWWTRTRAAGATLVFSSYYLSNPASAFGHTFLRLDRRPFAALGERVELTDLGVDYAATVDTGNSVLYALKGLLGLFRGDWSARPYFYKVREYADFESRDLWEYELDLPPEKVALLVAHLWELGSGWFRYYYLTQNCSYQIIAALEAADPRLDLVAHVGPVVIPADTVKALHRNPGLVRTVRYRPSARTQLEARMARLDGPSLDAVLALAERPEAPLPEAGPEARAAVLDAALDLYDVRNAGAVIRGEKAAVDRRQELLLRRATVPVVSPPLELVPPARGGPERGHDSVRIEAGGGGSRAEGPVAVLGWRLALHDLADPPAGFAPGSQLEFLKVRLRAGQRHGGTLRLDGADLVEVATYTALDRLDPRITFHARLGSARIRDGGCRSCVAGQAELGGGATVAAGPVLLGITAEGSLDGAPDLAGLGGSGFRLGVGPSALLRLGGGERASLVARGSWRHFPRARPDTGWELSVQGRLHLGRASLFVEGRKLPGDAEALGGLQLFY
ncbi:MAG: DUF4105 domain-containing protein [Deltaproteobacteria bacterium]|nr:DUF4105 domain-containing protein [Deltaproteobacteria bacterium]